MISNDSIAAQDAYDSSLERLHGEDSWNAGSTQPESRSSHMDGGVGQ